MPRFKKCCADHRSGESLTGSPDDTFYTEFDCTDTQAGAEIEAERISFEKYRGDFAWGLSQ